MNVKDEPWHKYLKLDIVKVQSAGLTNSRMEDLLAICSYPDYPQWVWERFPRIAEQAGACARADRGEALLRDNSIEGLKRFFRITGAL